MVTPVVYPAIMAEPFAINGDKNTIPTTPDATPGHASLDLGFPPLTRTPIEFGGVPPSGRDINGILNFISQHTVFGQAGGKYKFDAAFATYVGGYSKGFVLQNNAGDKLYMSLVDNNTVDFNTTPASIGVQWQLVASSSAANTITTINTTGGTVTLTPAQAAADIILVTGTLTSTSAIVFPNNIRNWTLINSTTGAFSVFAKAALGQSLTMTQGFTNTVFYDGTQIVFPDHDSGLDSPAFRGNPTAPTQVPLTNNTSIATTAYADLADQALLINTHLTGIPTVPTAPPNTNNNQIASTAYADAAVAAGIVSIAAAYVNANFSAGSYGDLWTDTSAGPITITLPDPPVGKNLLIFRDIFGSWSSNNLTINTGTKTILGSPSPLIANTSGRTFGMWYDTVASTWKVI